MQIEIAKILKPQGIKGEIKALPLTNLLSVYKKMKTCFIEGQEYIISSLSLRQDFLYIKLAGIVDRNQAELLRNKIIFIDRELLENEKEEGQFLIDELIGMLLYNEKGDYVGQIVDVVNYGACDVFIIEKEGRKMEAPYIDDVFVAKDNKLIVNQQKFEEVCV